MRKGSVFAIFCFFHSNLLQLKYFLSKSNFVVKNESQSIKLFQKPIETKISYLKLCPRSEGMRQSYKQNLVCDELGGPGL